MMQTMITREADRIAASGGFGTAVWVHAAWLAAFLSVWGKSTGTPLMPGLTIYEQLLFVQWSLMVILFPWAAVRLVAAERGDAIVLIAARLALRPSRILGARIAAISIALALVVVAGLPLVVIAQRMSDVSALRVVSDQIALGACGIVVAAVVTALQQAIRSRIVAWLLATASCGVPMWMMRDAAQSMALVGVAIAVAGVAGATLVALRGDASLCYLSESPA